MSKLFRPLKYFPWERRLFRGRVKLMGIGLGLLALILFVRLGYLQIGQYRRYQSMAQQNHQSVVPLASLRGLIFDRHGTLLAGNRALYSLVLFPTEVNRAYLDETIKQLQSLLILDREVSEQGMRMSKNIEPIVLKQSLREEEVARFSMNQYRFPGIKVQTRFLRYYPLGKEFASVVGYVGRVTEEEHQANTDFSYSSSDLIGKMGVERYYEKQLRGVPGYQQVEVNVHRKILRTHHRVLPVAGEQLYLTLDAGLQVAAQQALGRQIGTVVVLNPNNGEVLALVNHPSFDPNHLMGLSHSKDSQKLWRLSSTAFYNRAIQGHYPPASVIKPFLGVTALQEKVIRPSDTIEDTGEFQITPGGRVYHNIYQIAWGKTALHKAIMVSSDIYFYDLSLKMGLDLINKSLGNFGYGQRTGIDLFGEAGGLLPTRDWKRKRYGEKWYLGDTVNMGIGQGFMLATPLQMAVATGVLALSGMSSKPRVLLGSKPSPAGEFVYLSQGVNQRLEISSYIWGIVHRAMADVVTRGSASPDFRGVSYNLGAKTGTAQVFSLKPHQRYSVKPLDAKLRDHSLFVAFAPLRNPKIVLAVVLENSTTRAARVARKVLDYYFEHQQHIMKSVAKV